MDAGALLRERRRAHGLSQRELAIRAGTRQATISRIENGREIPTVQRLDQLLIALGERLELQAVPFDTERDTFLAALTDEPTILDAVHLTGPNDYELTTRCTGIDELDALLDRLKTTLDVERSDTRIVLAHPIRREPDPTHPRTIPRPVGRRATRNRRR